MLVNRLFEISGELKAELVLSIIPNAPRVSFYYRIQSVLLCLWNYGTGVEGRHYGDLGVAGGTIGFQNDNLKCRQGQRGCRVDALLFSVYFIWIVK